MALFCLLLLVTRSIDITVDALPSAPQRHVNVDSLCNLVTTWTLSSGLKRGSEEFKLTPGASTSAPVLARSVLFVPPKHLSKDVTFLQRATSTRIQGRDKLQSLCNYWESTFETARDVRDEKTYGRGAKFGLERVSTTGQTTVIVQWNVTWVPPTAIWLESLCSNIPGGGWDPVYKSYTHLSDQRSTFSYSAVFKLFRDAFATGSLRIPLACIQGTSILEFEETKPTGSPTDGNNADPQQYMFPMLRLISEDLSYAQDMERGALQNRKCAADLKVFLETGRCMLPEENGEWDNVVDQSLPWQSVPGMNPLEVDPQEDDKIAVPIFLGLVAVTLIGFMSLVAPEFIGQSLFGGPTYIVAPDELNSLF